MAGIQTSKITTDASDDLVLDPATGKEVQIKSVDVTNPGETPVSVNADGTVKRLDVSALTELTDPDAGDYIVIQAGTVRADDSAGTTVAGDLYKIDGENLGGSSKPADPAPGEVTAVPDFIGGSGTSVDPFIITPATVSAPGENATSAQLITISGQKTFVPVPFTDLTQGADNRFAQPGGVTDAAGDYVFNFLYSDTPNTPLGSGQVYNGSIKVGTSSVYFNWDVTQIANLTQFGPVSSPNASPTTVDYAADNKYGTVTATWADGSETLTATNMVFGVNGGAMDGSVKNVSDGDSIAIGFVDSVVAAASEGETITGSIQGSTYSAQFSMVKSTVPEPFTIQPRVDQTASAETTTGNEPVKGINAPTTLTAAGSSANQLTNTGASINGNSAVASGTFNPGDSLQGFGTTGATGDTVYQATFTVGGVDSTWDVTTSAATVDPKIGQPLITSPANGSVDLTADVVLTGSAYDPQDGANAHSATTWEVYETDSGEVDPITSEITTVATETVGGFARAGHLKTAAYGKVVYGSGIWAAAADNGIVGEHCVYYSTDGGQSWAHGGQSGDNYSMLNTAGGFDFGAGVFSCIVLRQGGDGAPVGVYTSSDAVDWTRNQNFIDEPAGNPTAMKVQYRDMVFGDGKFVALGYTLSTQSGSGSNIVITSTNGTNFTSGTLPATAQWQKVAYGLHDGKHTFMGLAGGASSRMVRSEDSAASWTNISGPSGLNYLKDLAYGDGKWYVVGGTNSDSAHSYYSLDNGNTWTRDGIEGLGSDRPESVSFANGKFYIGYNNPGNANFPALRYSSDGLNWRHVDMPSASIQQRRVRDVNFADGVTIAVGGDTNNFGQSEHIMYSPNGISFGGEEYTLTLTDNKVYDLNSGAEVAGATISDVFKEGDEVESSSRPDKYTGILSADANDSTLEIKLSGSIKPWISGQKVRGSVIEFEPTAPTTEPPNPAVYTAVTPSATTLTTATLNSSNLNAEKAYYSRVKYSDGNVESAFSEYNEFSTAETFGPPEPGAEIGGGYFAGQIFGSGTTSGGGSDDAGVIYDLIVSPASSNGLQGRRGQSAAEGDVAFRNWATALNSTADAILTRMYWGGELMFGSAIWSGTYADYDWLRSASGPNAGSIDQTNAAGTGIGGFNDWYVPAWMELDVIYRDLKPLYDPNYTSNTANLNEYAVPVPRTIAYTANDPAQTTNPDFKYPSGVNNLYTTNGGTQKFYRSCTFITDGSATQRIVWFGTGQHAPGGVDSLGGDVMAVRRQKA